MDLRVGSFSMYKIRKVKKWIGDIIMFCKCQYKNVQK